LLVDGQWQANWKINRAEPKGGQRQAEADVRHVQFAPVG
jgi:hypothetical protein